MPIIKRHQTLLDFATQHGGQAEELLTIAFAYGLSPTAIVEPGADLNVTEVEKNVVSTFQKKGLNISSVPFTASPMNPLQGIGYWIIGLDFKVS